MARELITGNGAAGYVLAQAGEANRSARGCCCGAYPITPQTEIIEYLRGFEFAKGRVVPVESEHSAMAVCIGASLGGARAFTASSANGLAYMAENVFAAGYFRLPIVMIAVNRTLGPPWNIWADQGDSLALRDAAWVQFYVESHQELVDTILMAFRIAEDSRVMLPVMVCMDGFIVSHTQMVVDLPEQQQVDAYLPTCSIPHRLNVDRPATVGGLAWPRETEHMRHEIQQAMERVPAVLEEARGEFEQVFGRRPHGVMSAEYVDEAETVVVASNTIARTVRNVIEQRRVGGEAIGLVSAKLFRPFPRDAIRAALHDKRRVAVLDRNHSPGSGGIFWQEIAATLQGCDVEVLQDYVVGLGGGDVTPDVVNRIIDDLVKRETSAEPVWEEVTA
ncbi:MAG: pyruvate ferredoxin oxidoreductase [Phycisphaerales bacterium]|nr:pyruvate ferredoxin oxidoreductase [Phycisphaerales bacterium]MCB9854549.1 pyruvate ferredoxin oxidoreductase [Phycisphaerales bacterium]MCB9863204.1 pyruvate ferredoxin oxidoreductase [Phycisphaerales bacterium]